jgi:hypothetical protein
MLIIGFILFQECPFQPIYHEPFEDSSLKSKPVNTMIANTAAHTLLRILTSYGKMHHEICFECEKLLQVVFRRQGPLRSFRAGVGIGAIEVT